RKLHINAICHILILMKDAILFFGLVYKDPKDLNRQENTPKSSNNNSANQIYPQTNCYPSLCLSKASLTLSTGLKIVNKTRPIFARHQCLS
ncbi:MAG: hypothetical protein MR582_03875, partial [Campylobacter sp.]|nr:hypothetical protein [Campylobacter sp.]